MGGKIEPISEPCFREMDKSVRKSFIICSNFAWSIMMQSQNLNALSISQRWILAIRPRTLPAAAAPVILGWSIAFTTGSFRLGSAIAALVCAVMIQIATNLVNDVVDFDKGADTEERTGPTRVTQTGLLTPRQVWGGVWVTFGIAALAGAYLALIWGWAVILIGALSILAGIAYTAGPFPLAYIGLGDLFVMVFFGFVAVCGTVFVTSGSLPVLAWFGAAAAGALTVNILVVNNIRDIDTDRAAGRKNIAILFGRQVAAWEYAVMVVIAYAVPPVLVCKEIATPWVLIALLSLPQGIKLWSVLRGDQAGLELNPILGKTAQLLLIYSLLFAAGLLVGQYI
jgi:1,4-dihydroxy-2-naphthoate octaprenyltransferase